MKTNSNKVSQCDNSKHKMQINLCIYKDKERRTLVQRFLKPLKNSSKQYSSA